MPYWYVLLLICLPTAISAVDDRLILKAKINGEYVRLAYDTGSSASLVIFKSTVERLGLNVAEESGLSVANFELEIDIDTFDAQALVIDSLPFPDIDGVVGWPVLRGGLWRVRWDDMTLSEIPAVPNNILIWQVFKLDSQAPVAAAFIREDIENLIGLHSEGVIYLDTGAQNGIELSDSRWSKEIAERPDLPMTITSSYSPAADGFYVTNVRWSELFQIGPLKISCVMVRKSPFRWPNLEAVLGLEALKHFEIIFDLKKYLLYMKERPYYQENFKYNRLGATFTPKALGSDALVGHVLKNSPAYKAGLRTGDILLRIDNIDTTKWRSDPTLSNKHFFKAEAGTKYRLEVERHGKRHVIMVALENILNIPDPLNCGQKHNNRMQSDVAEPRR